MEMKDVISDMCIFVEPPKRVKQLREKAAKEICALIKKEIKKYPQIKDLELGGSFAKQTWLMQNSDIDIFIKFKKDVSEKEFEKISLDVGLSVLPVDSRDIRYSQHPYVEGKIKDTRVNIVPCYDVKNGEWKSAADRSPFHTRYMKKSLTPKMRNEVRILKTFLRSNRISGAEIATQGFSGYVAEVLILRYKSFKNLINSISKIKERQVIGEAVKTFDTPLVIMDPVDGNRNLAAAISAENIGKFILLCRAFKEKPSKEFFEEFKAGMSEKYWNNLLVVRFNFTENRPDIIWGQIKKITGTLSSQLESNGFTVFRSKSHVGEDKKIYLFFFLESIKISNIYSQNGPEFFRQDDSERFISKNLKNNEPMWIGKNQKITALKKRHHVNAIEFMSDCLKDSKKNVPKGLQKNLEEGFEVSIGKKRLTKSIKEAASELISVDDVFLYFN